MSEQFKILVNFSFSKARFGSTIRSAVISLYIPLLFLQVETALMYDAVHLFAKALHDLDTSQQIDIHPLSCDGQVCKMSTILINSEFKKIVLFQDTWPHGYSLINYMKIVIFFLNSLFRHLCINISIVYRSR